MGGGQPSGALTAPGGGALVNLVSGSGVDPDGYEYRDYQEEPQNGADPAFISLHIPLL